MTLTQPPFISFIVPVYNVPTEMLCECLHSLFSLALQAHDVQIIVVDDGCDYDITQGWQPAWIERVTLIRQANQGLSMARNNALAVATGNTYSLLMLMTIYFLLFIMKCWPISKHML